MTREAAALLIGVSEYPPGIDPLPAAVKDVEAMARVLKNPEMGDFKEVKILTNPDKQSMEFEIEDFFFNRNKDDLVVLFFSGHGFKDENTDDLYFCTRITRKRDNGKVIRATAVSASSIHTSMNDCEAKRQVIILDCCYSGAFDRKTLDGFDVLEDIKKQLGTQGRVVLTSCRSTEYSRVKQRDSDLSLYTHYLVEGIKTGAGDRNEDGKITIGGLHKYTLNKVQEAAPSMTPQIIYLKGEGSEIIIAKAKLADPELTYRRKVERYAIQGEITIAAREILDIERSKLGIPIEVAEKIEAEVLRPFRERKINLQKYEETFRLTYEEKRYIDDRNRSDLDALLDTLGLRREDVSDIEKKITQGIELRSVEFKVVEVDGRGNILKEDIAKADYFREDLGNGIVLEMVKIPSGSFIMGSPKTEDAGGAAKTERPEHLVTVASFFMGMFVITQEQYEQVMGKGRNPSQFKGAKNPVERINWHDAKEFCQMLSQITRKTYRLPTEAEWEYACRAGTRTPFYLGATITSELANYKCDCIYAYEKAGKSRDKTVEVRTYPPNRFGLYDMCGNVWEWCEDNWQDNYNGAPIDGSAWFNDSTKRILRGGAWTSFPVRCRSASRYSFEASGRTHCNGFRVVCSIN